MKLPLRRWPEIRPVPSLQRTRMSVRLLWMAGIWCGSVAVLLVLAYLLRLLLR